MPYLLHELIEEQAQRDAQASALLFRDETANYATLHKESKAFAQGLLRSGLQASDRVAVLLPKQLQTVYSIFGTSMAGGTFVPVNPLLKTAQLQHVLSHSNTRFLVTSWLRMEQLREVLVSCPELEKVILVDDRPDGALTGLAQDLIDYTDFIDAEGSRAAIPRISTDMAAILYTSGSTGKAKGVVLSHRNLLAGAESVASYLHNTSQDRLLAVLPLSFDAGFSQLTTAFLVGASVVLMDYLVPRDVVNAAKKYTVTGLAAVPPLWQQLQDIDWPAEVVESLRYITTTGGAMPTTTTAKLKRSLPKSQIYLMYGLTEAFRSTYLPPELVDEIPESIGKAIPNVDIHVVNQRGEECTAGEVGELVHRGALVSMGYWRDPETTAMRFRPPPGCARGVPAGEMAVWSGDQVRRDERGFLYFVGRSDDMIKTSGYRVSPSEVEEAAISSGLVTQAAALGVAHAALGQAVLLIVTSSSASAAEQLQESLKEHCRRALPNYMMPQGIVTLDALPTNQNGKIDRPQLASTYAQYFDNNQT